MNEDDFQSDSSNKLFWWGVALLAAGVMMVGWPLLFPNEFRGSEQSAAALLSFGPFAFLGGATLLGFAAVVRTLNYNQRGHESISRRDPDRPADERPPAA
jgi:hypothetical protein